MLNMFFVIFLISGVRAGKTTRENKNNKITRHEEFRDIRFDNNKKNI